MLNQTEAYKEAIVADHRKTIPRAVVDISDPDLVYGEPTSSGVSPIAKPEQLHDKVFTSSSRYITLEKNRWALDATQTPVPDDLNVDGQVSFVGNVLSDSEGNLSAWVELPFSDVDILQACSVYFSTSELDGIPVDFTVEVYQGGTVQHTKTFTGNTEASVLLEGFTVYNPDAIRVNVTKISTPNRYLRVNDIIVGVYEIWDGNIISAFDVYQQGNFSGLALPYGTCSLSMDNKSRRFEPRRKDGIFQSIQERQALDLSIGVDSPDGVVYMPIGRYYQYSGGWRTGNNGLTMQWSLVDIIGLLADRQYILPSTLPTTLEGWIQSIVSQLGDNFSDKYIVDPDYASLSLSVYTSTDIAQMSCGELLRYACMATGTWARADASTGKLAVEPYWNQGNSLDLDNIESYPTMSANDDIAAVIFTLANSSRTQVVISGNSTTSNFTVAVKNPFIKTQEQAVTAAKMIISTYGGNRITTFGRGNPASEIGDVDTVQLDESSATTARRMAQSFSFGSGILKSCQSILLQADGIFLYEDYAVITEDGTWTAPEGVTQLRIILVGGGTGGGRGEDGSYFGEGAHGENGSGGKVYSEVININEGQSFDIVIGQGGAKAEEEGEAGEEGGDTTFGAYSSANGSYFTPSYTDIETGNAYARTGTYAPLDGTGDGGRGGDGGSRGYYYTVTVGGATSMGDSYTEEQIVDITPGVGKRGVDGASGCVVIYWAVV